MNRESRPEAAHWDLTGSTLNRTESGAIRLDSQLDRLLDRLADDLLLGRVELHQIPASLFTWWQYGALSRQAELDTMRADLVRVNAECDRLWLHSFGDQARRDYLAQRLEASFALADRDDVPDLVAEAARIYVASLDDVRSGVAA